MAKGVGSFGERAARVAAACFIFAFAAGGGSAQTLRSLMPGETAPIPPADIPNIPAPASPAPIAPSSPGASLTSPRGGVAPPPPAAAAPPVTPPAPAAPMVPPGQVALAVSARFGRDPPAVTGALVWRVYNEKPDANGGFKL